MGSWQAWVVRRDIPCDIVDIARTMYHAAMSQDPSTSPVCKIVSGGQTGVDRAALDAAIFLGIPHGGWCPKGRRSEDGTIPERYELVEVDARDYSVRTEQNVIDSVATLILCRGEPSGGTAFTQKMARKHKRPCLTIDLLSDVDPDVIRQWLIAEDVRTLNVAGPRASSSDGIGDEARELLVRVFE